MDNDGKDVGEIAKAIDRTKNLVSKYVKGELEELRNTIVQAQVDSLNIEDEDDEVVKVEIFVPDDMYDETIYKLTRETNYTRMEATHLIDRVIKASTVSPQSAKQLFGACMRSLNAKDLMLKKYTIDGKPTAAVMTKAASEKGDSAAEKARDTKSRTSRGAIWKIREEVIE